MLATPLLTYGAVVASMRMIRRWRGSRALGRGRRRTPRPP
jgi:hypothetical protein